MAIQIKSRTSLDPDLSIFSPRLKARRIDADPILAARVDALIPNGGTGTAGDDFMFGVEPGSADDTVIDGLEGDDLAIGDFPNLHRPAGDPNNSLDNAYDLEAIGSSAWGVLETPIVGEPSIAHGLIYVAATAGEQEWFSFTATGPITIDIDYGASNIGGTTDTIVELLDTFGNVVATNDNADIALGGLGSSSTLDSYISFTPAFGGTYYIRVYEAGGTPSFEGGEVFIISLSVEDHASTTSNFDGDDTITGGPGFDELFGLGGNDSIVGDGEGDVIHGGTGGDTMKGGLGDDTIHGFDGPDSIDGGAQADTLILPLSLFAAPGGVSLQLETGISNVAGVIVINIENAVLTDGDDTVSGALVGSYLQGLAGNDLLLGLDNSDILAGGNGNDQLAGGLGADTLDGGSGRDSASYLGAAGVRADLARPETNTGEASGDSYVDIENLTGSEAKDVLLGDNRANAIMGGPGRDLLTGRGGDDTLIGGNGKDALDGGDGIDTASYADGPTGVTVDMITPANGAGYARLDSYVAVENLLGSKFADVLRADNLANLIEGGAGADQLDGRGGADTLAGGRGADTLTGGSGKDRFVIDSDIASDAETIVDLTGADHIALDGDLFGLPEGALAAGRFVVGGAAQNGNDRLIYNDANGRLFFDPDGTGAQAQVLIATLTGAPALSAGDFTVI